MNLYDILGVPPTATAAEIKQQWKTLSWQYHPDRGGNADKMADINHAYEILGDAEKRQRFDSTGETKVPLTFEQEVRRHAMLAIRQAVEHGSIDPLSSAVAAVQQQLNQLTVGSQAARQKRAVLQRQRSRIKGPEENLFYMVMDQFINDIDSALAKNYEADSLLSAVFKLLTAYSIEPETGHSTTITFMTSRAF